MVTWGQHESWSMLNIWDAEVQYLDSTWLTETRPTPKDINPKSCFHIPSLHGTFPPEIQYLEICILPPKLFMFFSLFPFFIYFLFFIYLFFFSLYISFPVCALVTLRLSFPPVAAALCWSGLSLPGNIYSFYPIWLHYYSVSPVHRFWLKCCLLVTAHWAVDRSLCPTWLCSHSVSKKNTEAYINFKLDW